MTTGQIAYLVRIANRDGEARLGRLLETHARVHGAPYGAWQGSLYRRRLSRPGRIAVDIVVVDTMRVWWALATNTHTSGGQSGAQGRLLFHGRDGRSQGRGAGIASGSAATEGTEGIILDGLEAGGLSDNSARGEARGAGGGG